MRTAQKERARESEKRIEGGNDMRYAFKSVKGLRSENQDSCYIPPKEAVPAAIVADGMGGHNAGLTASKLAVEAAVEFLNKNELADKQRQLREAVEYANKRIYSASLTEPEFSNMGTTFVAVIASSDELTAVNVGDSRIYVIDSSGIRRISNDHSLVHELVLAGVLTEAAAKVHPYRNIITSALGTHGVVEGDIFVCKWKDGDYALLCSDGLHGCMSDDEIERIVKETPNMDEACEKLVSAALSNGSTDNVTVVLVKNEEVCG